MTEFYEMDRTRSDRPTSEYGSYATKEVHRKAHYDLEAQL